MRQMILVLDESGDKQYSNNPEAQPWSFGIMAGVLLPKGDMNALAGICKDLFSPYFHEGKRHITDLEPQQSESLRKNVIDLFNDSGLRWFYEAIYSQGFHENFHVESRLGCMTYGAEKKHLLHAKLFRGMLHKSIDLLAQGGTSPAHIKVITDRVDQGILRKFEDEAEGLVSIWLGKEKVETISSYDKETKKVEKKLFSSSMTLEGIPQFSSLTYEICCEDSDLTFLTDILANMTRYYIGKALQESDGFDLNSRAALSKHPIGNLAVTCGSEGQFTDRLYRRERT